MRQYNCPDCTHIEDSCYNCTRFLHQFDEFNNVNTNFEDYTGTPYNSPSLTAVPKSCKNCPQHPSNGGNGICHCILGLPEIT